MINNFNLCPMCGEKNIQNIDNIKWFSPDCECELFRNVASAVGIIIYNENKNVLFKVRNKDPRKGFLAIPGGFANADETIEEAAKRECLEEIGVNIGDIEYLCSFPNTYPYKNVEYKTCDCFFTAKIDQKYRNINEYISKLHRQESEVCSFVAYSVKDEESIKEIPIAFVSTANALKKFINKNQ